MIKSIRIKNFMGIENEFELSFVADKRREKTSNQKVKTTNDDLLTVVGIFGKNGSGKTSILEAINFIAMIGSHFNSAYNFMQSRKNKTNNQEFVTIDNNDIYKMINSRYAFGGDNKIEISYKFIIENNEYEHYISYEKNGNLTEIVSKNSEEAHNAVCSIDKRVDPFIEIGIKNQLIVLLTELNIFKTEYLFLNFSFFNDKYSFDEFKKILLNWIRIADDKVIDLKMDDKFDIESFLFQFDKSTQWLLSSKLSSGTKKWINIFKNILTALQHERSIFLMDEIDSRWHNSLTDFLIQLFSNPSTNKMNSQLLFTSHNASIIRNNFRKDAINLIEDNLVVNIGKDYNIRNDFVFSKNYLAETLGNHPSAENKIDFIELFMNGEVSDDENTKM